MSDLTTIKVSRRVRDRLAAAAHTRGVTLRALLEDLSRQAEDAAALSQVGREMSRVREGDPAAWADYLEEGRAWEEGMRERLDS